MQRAGSTRHVAYPYEFRRHVNNGVTPPTGREWSKDVRPARLFESVMGRPPAIDHSRHRTRRTIEPPLVSDPFALPDDLSRAWRFRLEDCARSADVSGATAVLADISARNGHPSVHAIALAIDAATAASDVDQAERFLREMSSSLPIDEGSETDARHNTLRYSKTRVALTYAQAGNYEDALRIMELAPILSLAREHRNQRDIVEEIVSIVHNAKADLGHSAGSWGVVVRALCGLGLPHAAVAVADKAVNLGVSVTDGFLQVTLDALRMIGRWQDAAWLFETSIQKGLTPSERTISSALRALTCRNARKLVDVEQVERVAALAENASESMLSNCIVAFSAIGAVAKVEQMFAQLALQNACPPSKLCFSARMASYANFIELLDDTTVDEVRREDIYGETNEKADGCWIEFLRAYRLLETSGGLSESDDIEKTTGSETTIAKHAAENSNVLKNYLRTKVRCFKTEEALAVLENIVDRGRYSPSVNISSAHIATVLGAIELCSDVDMLKRILKVMRESGVRHDMRSVAFTIGTFLGDGDLERALRTVREEGHAVVAEAESALRIHSSKPSSTRTPSATSCGSHVKGGDPERNLQISLKHAAYRSYFPTLFLRRLSSLAAAFADVGVGRVPDLKAMITRLNNWPRSKSFSR